MNREEKKRENCNQGTKERAFIKFCMKNTGGCSLPPLNKIILTYMYEIIQCQKYQYKIINIKQH